MALEGTIKEFGLADIFQLIGLQKKTGILFLKGEEESVYIHFEDGMVVKAEESKKRPKNLLGHILLSRGKITEDNLREALDMQKSTGQKLGGTLIGRGLINKDDLRDALGFQMSETIYKVFRWKGGDYKFDQERVDYDRDTIAPISSEHILMDGVRMLDEWPIIEKKLPSYDIVLAKKQGISTAEEKPKGDDDIFAGFDEKDSGKHTAVSKELEAVLSLVDGKKSIYEILDFSRLGEFDTFKALTDLIDKGYIVRTGARPEILSTKEDHAPEALKAGGTPSYFGRLPYVFIGAAVLLIFLQVTGARKIMSAHATGLEALKAPFSLNQAEEIRHNSVLYYLDNGSYPDSPKMLEQLDYIGKDALVGPWGSDISIGIDKDGVTVVDAGPDRTLKTADDISTSP